ASVTVARETLTRQSSASQGKPKTSPPSRHRIPKPDRGFGMGVAGGEDLEGFGFSLSAFPGCRRSQFGRLPSQRSFLRTSPSVYGTSILDSQRVRSGPFKFQVD